MTGEHSARGRAYRAERADPRFRHAARGRAQVPAPRPAPHPRTTATAEQPAVLTSTPVEVPFWLEALIWFIAVAVAVAVLGSAWAVCRVWQVERAVEKPIVITLTPSTTP